MNCKHCDRPCKTIRHDLERCPGGCGEWYEDGHWLWRTNRGRFDGEEVTVDGEVYELTWKRKAE